MVVIDQLQEIAVTGGDDHPQVTALATVGGNAADDVIGLISGSFLERNVQCVDELTHAADLRAQIVGHGAPVALVFANSCSRKVGPLSMAMMAKSGCSRAEVVKRHGGKAEDRVGTSSFEVVISFLIA